MWVSIDTVVVVGALVIAAIYAIPEAVAGVNLLRLHEARRIAAESLHDKRPNRLLGELDGSPLDRAAVESLIAYRPPPVDIELHTERRGLP